MLSKCIFVYLNVRQAIFYLAKQKIKLKHANKLDFTDHNSNKTVLINIILF